MFKATASLLMDETLVYVVIILL